MTLLVKMSANVVSSPSSPPLSASLFFDNPYFSAGAGLIGIGTGLAILRRVSLRYALYLQRQLFTSVEISNKDKSYYWVLHWLSEVQSSTVSSLTKATSDQHTGRLNVDARRILPFSFSFFRDPLHAVVWTLDKGDNTNNHVVRSREKGALMDISSGAPFETVTLTTLGQCPQYFIKVLEEAKRYVFNQQSGKTLVYTSWANEWRPFGHPRRKRPISSVILEDNLSERIVIDVKDFISNSKWYYERGIPYRRGYLLYGPPGTGKSSFIIALAGHLDYNICLINLSESVMTDDRLQYLFSVLPERSILLLEDIDGAFVQRTSTNAHSRITFSGLLNAIDGVGSSEERIIFMTTNHIELLDEALLRPGRVDVREYVGMATPLQIEKMFTKFYPDEPDHMARAFVEELKGAAVSPAMIQGHFIVHKNDPREALKSCHLLVKSKTC